MGRRGLMIEFRYIHAFKDRHGKERYYFRRHGIRKPLPGAPGDAEFVAHGLRKSPQGDLLDAGGLAR